MRQLGSTIECYRGESFAIGREFVDKDNQPLYIPDNAKNPFVRFTVSSNTYKIDGKYKKNYWLDYSKSQKFAGFEQFPNNKVPDNVSLLSKDTIYYVVTESGREYYFVNGDKVSNYGFLVFKRFLNADTKKWVGQIYQYEIAYCDGELMVDWLTKVFKSLYPGVEPPKANSVLADYICKKRSDLLRGLNVNEPFISYTVNKVLQGPCKLIVKEN